jgi:hypothetical protein
MMGVVAEMRSRQIELTDGERAQLATQESELETLREYILQARSDTDVAFGDGHEAQDTVDFGVNESVVLSAMKKGMSDAFNGKCAFCETKIAATDQHVDVEHDRPKKGVTDEHDRPIRVVWHDGKDPTHPGYFWLAYDWTNLLPSCALCNQPNTSRDGRAVGKRNRFPITGYRACKPGEEAQEYPILINPMQDDPALELDIETGIIIGLTERGRKCIEILDLNRDGLMEKRRDLYRSLKRFWNDVFTTQLVEAAERKQNVDDLSAHKHGKREYTLVARKAIRELGKRQDEIRRILQV